MKNLLDIIKQGEAEFIEKGANLEHDRWARWQQYMFSLCLKDGNPGLIIPQDLVEQWQRQINTPYSELSEEEKESDRKETRNYLPLIRSLLIALIEGGVECYQPWQIGVIICGGVPVFAFPFTMG